MTTHKVSWHIHSWYIHTSMEWTSYKNRLSRLWHTDIEGLLFGWRPRCMRNRNISKIIGFWHFIHQMASWPWKRFRISVLSVCECVCVYVCLCIVHGTIVLESNQQQQKKNCELQKSNIYFEWKPTQSLLVLLSNSPIECCSRNEMKHEKVWTQN